MNVLHVYKDYDPPVKGGIEGHINLLANGLHRRNVSVRVLVANTNGRDAVTVEGAIPVYKARQWGRLASAPISPTFPRLLKQLGMGMDIVHFHFPNPTGEVAALCAGLTNRLVVTYHSDIVRQKRLKLIYQPFMIRFLSKVDRIIATSPHYRESSAILEKFRKKTTIIPLGIDSHRFCLSHNQSSDPSGEPEILFIGRFRYYKGLHVLVNAMSHVSRGRLVLVGGGPEEANLQQMVAARNLGQRVKFAGELSHHQLIDRIQTCDFLVLPSVQRSEAFGIVLMEAMGCGKPVISTELGTGTSYVNQNGATGLVVPAGDPQALAIAINTLAEHSHTRRRMGCAARKRILNGFTADHMVDRTLKLYRELVNTENSVHS